MQIVIDISKDKYDEIMSMDWKNCRLIFGEEIRAIHDGKALEQEQCADMVSRDAMWDVLQRLHGTEGELVDELMSLPPVLPMPKIGKWIPVEIALPEETVSVLVYAERNAYGDNGKYRKKVIDIGWQVDGKWHIDGCNGVVGIAWMPLPTPPNKSEIPTGAEGSDKE